MLSVMKVQLSNISKIDDNVSIYCIDLFEFQWNSLTFPYYVQNPCLVL